jgi:hypothetical protein
VTSNTNFAVLGYEADTRTPSATLTGDGFAVSYDAVARTYTFDVPYAPPGTAQVNESNNQYWACPNGCTTAINIKKPQALDPALDYVTLASYYDYDWSGAEPFGYFAFGVPTASGDVPVTGSASYQASVLGGTPDYAFSIAGSASLQFNFGAGTLAGQLNPILIETGSVYSETALPTYSFVNTVFGVGNTSFSGGLQTSGTSELGSFNGMFMGPAAIELMARWKAPYYNPKLQIWSQMFGVLAGKKQ